jgi:hypothetical protein
MWSGSIGSGFGRAYRAIARTALAAASIVAAATANAADVTPLPTGRADTAVFLISGPIVAGDLTRLETAISNVPAGRAVAVILDSPGGNLLEGLKLGTYFHKAAIATFVRGEGGICFSACALAFLGGRDAATGKPFRVKMSGGKLGFHQFARANLDPFKIYTVDDFNHEIEMAQRIALAVVRYLKSIGEDLGKLQLMLRAPATSMNIIADGDCLSRGIHVLDEANGRLIDPATTLARISMR